MIVKKIKTIWEGKVGLHEKYIFQAKRTKSGILIVYRGTQEEYEGQEMMVAAEDIDKFTKGKEEYEERFGGPNYHLYYMKWDRTNKTLFN